MSRTQQRIQFNGVVLYSMIVKPTIFRVLCFLVKKKKKRKGKGKKSTNCILHMQLNVNLLKQGKERGEVIKTGFGDIQHPSSSPTFITSCMNWTKTLNSFLSFLIWTMEIIVLYRTVGRMKYSYIGKCLAQTKHARQYPNKDSLSISVPKSLALSLAHRRHSIKVHNSYYLLRVFCVLTLLCDTHMKTYAYEISQQS